jgi:hypothetical protein
VLSSRLRWNSSVLTLSAPEELTIEMAPGARSDIVVEPGDLVALHWGQVCDRLTPEQVARLKDGTGRQLHTTSRRLRSSSS